MITNFHLPQSTLLLLVASLLGRDKLLELYDIAIKNNYRFPLRIAIFPGVSCMFFCGFCGRNQSAKYPMSSVGIGTQMFKNLFEETKNNTLYSIGGGLEPTTNPQLGEIIELANKSNIRIPLITNGYSLTENFVKRNQLQNLNNNKIS